MAMNGSVDFTIRANDLTSKPTRDIVTALESLADAQKDVARSADDLSTSSSRLTAEQKALSAVSTELDRRMSDVTKYSKNAEAISEYTSQLKVAQDALDLFKTKFFEAQDSGSKDIIRTATDNLKVAQRNVEQLRSQISQLSAQQTQLQNRVQTRSGLDVTQGDTAKDTLAGAQALTQAAREQNVEDQKHLVNLAEEIRLENQAAAAAALRAAAEKKFQDQLAQTAESVKRNDYQTMYAHLLDEQEASLNAQKKLGAEIAAEIEDQYQAQKRAADELDRYNQIGTKALTSLQAGQQSRAANTGTAPVANGGAAAGVTAALDPLKAQTATLTGIEEALNEVNTAITAVGTSGQTTAAKIATLEAAEEKLAAVNKALATQASLADAFTKQNAAAQQAQASLAAAENEVERLATAMKEATVADDGLAASLQQAQGRLASAAATARTQSDSLARVEASATAAGIDVTNLANSEQRLTQAAQQSATSQKLVSDSLDQATTKSTGFGAALDKLGGSGRESLSLFQRIRGEVLALTASFVGVQAGVAALGSVLDVVKTDQAVRAQIAQTTNSPEEQAKQYAFLRAEAERTGFSFETVSKSYGLMARQALEYGLAQNTVNKLFSDGLTVGRSFNQSGEQLEGTFTALGQIFDKTTIQSEEFKKQLSNQGLAGLFPTLAKVMQDQGVKSIQDVQKAMENAQVPAAEIIKVFDALAKSGNVAFDQNMSGYAAKLNAFKTQLYEIQLQFAGGGFLDGVTQGLTALSAVLAKPETQENLKELGKDIGDIIAYTAQWATDTDNLQNILTAFEIYLSTKLLLTVVSLSGQILAFGTAGAEAAAGLTALGGASATFGTILGAATTGGVVTAVIALGAGLGYLLDKIPAVHDAMEELANMSAWQQLMALGPGALVTLPTQTLAEGVAQAQYGDEVEAGNKVVAAGDAYRQILNDINTKKKQGIALSQQEQKIADDVAAKYLALQIQQSVPGAPNAKKGANGVDQDAAAADTERSVAQAQIDATTSAAQKLQDAAQKKELKSRKDFLDLYTKQNQAAVDQATRTVTQLQAQFDKTGSTVDKAALTSAQNAQNALTAGIKAKADVDYANANAAAGKKQDAAVQAYETKRQSLHEQTNAQILAGDAKLAQLTAKADDDSLDARLKKVDTEIAQEYSKYEVAIRKNNDAITQGTKLGQDTSQLQADNVALKAAQDRLDLNKQIADQLATQQYFMDTANKDEQAINTKIQLRQAMLTSIQALQKSGNITSEDATRAAKTVDDNTLTGSGGIDDMFNKRIATNQAEIEDQIALGNATSEYTQKLELQNAQLTANKAAIDATHATTSQFAQDINKIVSGDVVQGIDGIAKEIDALAQGTESWGEAWKNVGDIILNTIANTLVAIGEYIIKQQILNALKKQEFISDQSGGGGGGGLLSTVISYLGSSSHTGGVVGMASSNVGGATPRNVSPAWFVGAPRFHTGGMPGLAPDEYPIIAQKGEEVITRQDPRNRLNGGASTSEVGAPGGATNVHFHADAPSFFSAGLQSRPGQKDMFAFFTANKQSLKSILK